MATLFRELPQVRNSRNKSQISHHSNKRKPTPRPGQYLQASMRRIEKGMYQNGNLTIDGGYGDYRMSIFRLKDRKKRMSQLPTIFTRLFIDEANSMAPDAAAKLKQIVETPNQVYLRRLEVENGEQQQKKFKKMHWKDEQEEQLIYQYVPKYQRQKWFSKTIDHCEPVRQQHLAQEPAKKKLVKTKAYIKPTHIFRFLDLKNSSALIQNLSNNTSA